MKNYWNFPAKITPQLNTTKKSRKIFVYQIHHSWVKYILLEKDLVDETTYCSQLLISF